MNNNEERELKDFQYNMDKHRQKIFMQLNGFKLNDAGNYEYDAALKIPAEDLKNPENENYDPIFAQACEKVDALREATQQGTLNLEESTASVWHYIARANNWTSEGGYAYDDDLGPGEFKVFGGGGKFNVNSSTTHTQGGMSVDPNANLPTLTGSDCDWNTYKDDDRKNVAVLVAGEPDWSALPPEEKGGKGDRPIDVPPGVEGGQGRRISGPTILMVPPTNCREGEVFCGGRCAVVQAGVVTSTVNCICLGACADVEGNECNGFKYEGKCCDNAKYCADGAISCNDTPCDSQTADRIPLPEEADLAYNASAVEAGIHDKYGIPSAFCQPVYAERKVYPNPEFAAQHKGLNPELITRDFNFSVTFTDGLFGNKWSTNCLSPVASSNKHEILRYSDNEDATFIAVTVETLDIMWTNAQGAVDHDKFSEYTKSWKLGGTNFEHAYFKTQQTYNGQPCSTKNCAFERMQYDPALDIAPGEPVQYDRWVINIWTTSEETGYKKITAQQYQDQDVGHIWWKIPSFGFGKWIMAYPWMATYEKAKLRTRCGGENLLDSIINL